ncbi:MAG: ABC transporter ATP-binding protein [Treponema sp.]|jgi:iron complex transport system ATP-binding protein|nr:ABC transporter ATP-binding protein [Treponema sp.]
MQKSVEVHNLFVQYRNRTVLKNLNCAVAPGELVVLIGANGSGKTTLLKSIGGFLKPKSGTVLIEGIDIKTLKARERAQKIAFLFQNAPPVWAFTVKEFVEQGQFAARSIFGTVEQTAVEDIREHFDLTAVWHRSMTELSGGEVQRVTIARAFVQQTPILLFDEPTNNLDRKYQRLLMEYTRHNRRCALVSLHDINTAVQYATKLLFLNEGTIIAYAPPVDIIQLPLFQEIFGADR